MFRKRTEAIESQRTQAPETSKPRRVSDFELFALGGASYRQVN